MRRQVLNDIGEVIVAAMVCVRVQDKKRKKGANNIFCRVSSKAKLYFNFDYYKG